MINYKGRNENHSKKHSTRKDTPTGENYHETNQ